MGMEQDDAREMVERLVTIAPPLIFQAGAHYKKT